MINGIVLRERMLMTKMVYRFDDRLQTTVYEAVDYFTRADVVNARALEWLDEKIARLGLDSYGDILMSDYVELANYKFKDSDELHAAVS